MKLLKQKIISPKKSFETLFFLRLGTALKPAISNSISLLHCTCAQGLKLKHKKLKGIVDKLPDDLNCLTEDKSRFSRRDPSESESGGRKAAVNSFGTFYASSHKNIERYRKSIISLRELFSFASFEAVDKMCL